MVSTPLPAPVTAATRLRGGNAAAARGAQAEGQHRDHAVAEQVFAGITSHLTLHLPQTWHRERNG